jgi:hypothetical protein
MPVRSHLDKDALLNFAEIAHLQSATQNGPGIASGAVSFLIQRINAQAVTPLAFSTYSSIWLKFRYL